MLVFFLMMPLLISTKSYMNVVKTHIYQFIIHCLFLFKIFSNLSKEYLLTFIILMNLTLLTYCLRLYPYVSGGKLKLKLSVRVLK